MTAATKAADTVLPPKLSGKQKLVSKTTSAVSASTSLFGDAAFTGAPAGVAPTGRVYLSVTAVTEDVYIAFSTGSGTVSATTGQFIQAGREVGYWITPGVDTHINYIAAGAGAIQWYVSSPEYSPATSVTT